MIWPPSEAMVFAAGFGTRMGHLTHDRPKPLLDVAGRSLLDHALGHLHQADLQRVVINTHYKAEQIHTAVQDRTDPQVVVTYEPEILETAGGLRAALPHFSTDPIYTMNSDTIFAGSENPLDVLARHWRDGMGALLLLVPMVQTLAHTGVGDFTMDSAGHLDRRGSAASAPFVYSGVQLLSLDLVRTLPPKPASLNVIWDQYLARHKLFGCVMDGPWVDVGTPAGLQTAQQVLEQH